MLTGDLSIQSIIDDIVAGGDPLSGLASGLKAARHLPKLLTDLGKEGHAISTLVGTITTTGPRWSAAFEGAASAKWTSDAPAGAQHAVTEIQDIISDLFSSATSILARIKAIEDSFAVVPALFERIPDVKPGIASYQRWSKGWFDLPCLTVEKQRIGIEGVGWTYVPVPIFGASIRGGVSVAMLTYLATERCRQDYSFPFPNHHIPYFALTFGSSNSRRHLSLSPVDVVPAPPPHHGASVPRADRVPDGDLQRRNRARHYEFCSPVWVLLG